MERSGTRDVAVGLFLLAGILAAGFLSLRVGGFTLTKPDMITVYAAFDEIGGLKTRAPVVIAGFKVGEVRSIDLDQNSRARVTMELDAGQKYPVDTSASIVTSGVLGDRYISLQLGGEEDVLKHGDTIQYTESAVLLERLLGKFIHNADVGGDPK
jgi:phospholipid/cholesterol/gamma-HCH transport system substrate-binding protein